MRFIATALMMLTFVGCVGNVNPHTVMGQPGTTELLSQDRGEKLWWQKNTYGLSRADNPWEKFNQPSKVDLMDPWAEFETPVLFTKEFEKKHIQDKKEPTL